MTWTKHQVRLLLWCINPAAPQAAKHALIRRVGGKKLGEGCYRTAFRLGNFVIKWVDPHQNSPLEPSDDVKLYAGLLGIKLAPTEVVNGWMIQPYYRPLTWTQWEKKIEDRLEGTDYWNGDVDFNSCNLGWDRFGKIVAFDW